MNRRTFCASGATSLVVASIGASRVAMAWQHNPLARLVVKKVESSTVIGGGRDPFTMLVHFTLVPASRGLGPKVAKASQSESRAEPGCLAYTWMQHGERPERLSLYERWKNLDALKFHFGTPHFAEVGRLLTDSTDSPPEIELYAELA